VLRAAIFSHMPAAPALKIQGSMDCCSLPSVQMNDNKHQPRDGSYQGFKNPACPNIRTNTIHSPAPRCGTIASVAFILWRVKQAANKLCWLASMCQNNTQGSSTLWNYSKCGVYTVESEAGC
jgi:hypothetical protein